MKKALTIFKRIMRNRYPIALFFLSLLFFYPIFDSDKTLNNIHYINDMTFQSENIRKYLHDDGAFPLWTPYFYSGQPFMSIPEYYIFDLNFIYILLFENIFLSMNLSVISYFFLAGLGMYLLVYKVLQKKNAAFIGSAIFMFNAFMHKFILTGHLNILESYALMPYIFLFTYKALHEKNVSNSVITAILLALMILAGGMIFFLYTGLMIGLYMAWNLIGKNFKQTLLKTVTASLIIILLLFGLSAFKLLPSLEFVSMSSRGSGVSYQEYLGNPISLENFWNNNIYISPETPFSASIGIVSFILLLLGLLSWRKKIVLYSALLIILSVLLASGTLIAQLFYLLPGFGQMRHIERALVLFAFAAPIIASFGFNNLIHLIKKNCIKIKQNMVFAVVLAFIAVELVLVLDFPQAIEVTRPKDIPILNEISKDNSGFRIANMALSTPIGASGYNYFTQLNIPAIKGGGGIWINDYVQYLAVAEQTLPSKLYGILSGKYIISDRKLEDPGLTLKNTFEKCEECPVWEAYGPYLYENRVSVPKAFVVDKAILILGDENTRDQVSYSLLVQNLNPLSNALIEDKNSVSHYSLEELQNFDAIILLQGSLIQNDFPKLKEYVNNGGKLLPNVMEGEDSITQESLARALNGNTNKELNLRQNSVNSYSAELDGERGWLVISERFAHFPGWKAAINEKERKIYKADKVISAVHLNGESGTLNFTYNPQSFTTGKTITIITILILVSYLVYAVMRYRKWLN